MIAIGELRGKQRRMEEKSWNVIGKSKNGEKDVGNTAKMTTSTPTSEKFVSCVVEQHPPVQKLPIWAEIFTLVSSDAETPWLDGHPGP